MARPQITRRICNPPKMKGYRPYGICSQKIMVNKLRLEEYESLRLINYELLDQSQAAFRMNVSRPTFTRIYNNALKQIAKSFVEGKAIEIEGGSFSLDREWYRCRKCFKLIQGTENHLRCNGCKVFGEGELLKIN